LTLVVNYCVLLTSERQFSSKNDTKKMNDKHAYKLLAVMVY